MFLTTNKGYIHSYKHFVSCGGISAFGMAK